MNLKTKQLNRLKDKEILVDIFIDCYNESVNGFIVEFNEEFLLLEKFNAECQTNGISILKTDNIARIRWGGTDSENIIKLIDQTKRIQDIHGIVLESWTTILQTV